MPISKKKAEKRIAELRKELSEHNRRYYVLNDPIITDFEYDILMQELIALEKMFPEFASTDSPSVKVGSDLETVSGVKQEFRQFPHKFPMLSLGNTYNAGELFDFDERIRKTVDIPYSYNCELKFDGTAICLTYSGGKLVRALTRGDGRVGDDVTDNVHQIANIPTDIGEVPFDFEIRGEIFMPFEAFDRLNAQREEDEEQPFANPRNAASGSLKLLDSSMVQERGLECVLYHVLGDDLPFKEHTEAISWAKGHGLPVSDYSKLCTSMDQVQEYISGWDTKRKFLPFPTDGIVIKVNDLALQKRLGFTAKTPRWATAFKFKPEEALTKLISIDYQVGRTGAITPVANLEPVQLSGTVVKRATLHNSEQMELLDIRINDYVYVEKGGEIIPKITRVELSKRLPSASKPIFPTVCPDCGSPLVKDESEAKHYCLNSDHCPTQIKGRFIHFISRHAMDILAGDATIEQLYGSGYIRELPDLYQVTKEQLLSLEGWQERSAQRFLDSLEKSKVTPFHRVLFALGIRHIGETTAKMLASHFHNIAALARASREELLQIDEVGGILAEGIISYFADAHHQNIIAQLQQIGLHFEEDASASVQISDSLEGCTVVISGNFTISREEMKQLITSHGGKNTGSVSGSTTYLLAGEKAGPEKLRKAEKLGIKVISEDDFYSLIK